MLQWCFYSVGMECNSYTTEFRQLDLNYNKYL